MNCGATPGHYEVRRLEFSLIAPQQQSTGTRPAPKQYRLRGSEQVSTRRHLIQLLNMASFDDISKEIDAALTSCRRQSRRILVGVAFMSSLMANQMVESLVNHVPFTTMPSSSRISLAVPDAVRITYSTKERLCMASCECSAEVMRKCHEEV